MKPIVLGLLISSFLLATPALAEHHEGHGKKQMSGPEFTAQHSAKMNAEIAHQKMAQERGLDLMKMGNEMLRKGKAKKDGKLMLAGARLLKMGHHMHEESMHALMETTENMKHHLMHAKVGDLTMSDAEMASLQKEMDQLKTSLDAYKNTCHVEKAQMPESAAMLVDMGNQTILDAVKNGDADKAQLGTEMMSMGMKMMGGDEHQKSGSHMEMRMEKEIKIIRE